jgi:hypothetical protein
VNEPPGPDPVPDHFPEDVIAVLENQQGGMSLDEAYERLYELHQVSGADFHVRLETAAHCGWQAEVRVTPKPHDPDTSDRSYVTFRAGPAEWALCQAVLDVLRWLAGAKPEYTDEPCLDCENDDVYGDGG